MGSPKKKSAKDEEQERIKEQKEKEKKTVKPARVEKKELREIIRIADTDLDADKPLIRAITGIRGINHSMAKAVCEVSGFDKFQKIGSLDESQVHKLEEVLKDPGKYGIPSYFLNRRKDIETGKDLHLSGSDLEVAKKFDIRRMVDLRNWKGTRHMMGLPVRGQRTRSSFRKGRAVGVVRKAVRIQLAKSGTEEKKEEKKK